MSPSSINELAPLDFIDSESRKVHYERAAPLHAAVVSDRIEIVELLVSKGANVDLQTDTGSTPLYVASLMNATKSARYLIAKSANYNLQNSKGLSPLHAACLMGNIEIARQLVRAGANVNTVAADGSTPLLRSVIAGRVEGLVAISAAMGNGKKIPRAKFDELVPIKPKSHALELASLLLQSGADPNVANEVGWTPLHLAAFLGNKEVLELLLRCKANREVKDRFGNLPINLAQMAGHKEVARILKSEAGGRVD